MVWVLNPDKTKLNPPKKGYILGYFTIIICILSRITRGNLNVSIAIASSYVTPLSRSAARIQILLRTFLTNVLKTPTHLIPCFY